MAIKHADVKRKKSLKILLFGDSGVGKTHLALKATPGKTLIFDAESGADFFEGQEGFDFDYWTDDDGLKTASIGELRKAIKYLSSPEGRKKYETFIVDPASDIWDEIQAQRSEFKDAVNLRKDERKQRVAINETDIETFNQKDWGDMKRVYKNMMLDLKNLPQNIFLLAREKEVSETRPDGSIVRTGEYTYEAEKNTKYAVDFVVRLCFDEKSGKRWAVVVKSRAMGIEKSQRFDNPDFSMFDKVVNLMGTKESDKLSNKKEKNVFEEEKNKSSNLDELSDDKSKILQLCKDLGGSKDLSLMEVLKKYHRAGNFNEIKDPEQLQKLFVELQQLKSNREKEK